MRQRRIETLHGAVNARQCGGISVRGIDPGARTHRRHQDHFVFHIVEDQHQRRTDQDRVRHAARIRCHLRKLLDEPHGVVAHEAENTGGHRRQRFGKHNGAFGQEVSQRLKRRRIVRDESIGIGHRRPVEGSRLADGLPDDVRRKADHGITAARRSPFDRFEEKTHRPPVAELQVGRNRRLQVGDKARPDYLRRALVVDLGEPILLRENFGSGS